MPSPLQLTSRLLVTAAAFGSLALLPTAPVYAAKATECTALKLCFCVNEDFKPLIAEKVKFFRAAIAEQRAKAKTMGYISVPLATS